MVSEFLKERLQLHVKHLDDLYLEQKNINIDIDETRRFITILEKEADRSTSSFSPYILEEKNKDKIIELRSKLHALQEQIINISNQIDEENLIVNQYKSVIIEAEDLEKGK